MNKQLLDKWVAALRSGEYEQAFETLRNYDCDHSYCCLGVLCDVIDPTGWSEDGTHALGDDAAQLSVKGLKIAQLADFDQQALMKLNDVEQLSFPEIATYIETHIPVES